MILRPTSPSAILLGPVHIGMQRQEAARHCRACRGNLAELGTVVAADVGEIPAASAGMTENVGTVRPT